MAALGGHALRARLTILGIAAGIAGVTTMVSMGLGANRLLFERLSSTVRR
jgi:hypothetical protein